MLSRKRRVLRVATTAAVLCLLTMFLGPATASAQDSRPHEHPSSAPSTTLSVSGKVVSPKTLSVAALKELPRTAAKVGAVVFEGAKLWDVLQVAGLAPDPAVRNSRVAMFVVARGSDGYAAVISLGEVDPQLAAQPILVAYEADGAPLGATGQLRLIVPNDRHPTRNVSRLATIEVRSAMAQP